MAERDTVPIAKHDPNHGCADCPAWPRNSDECIVLGRRIERIPRLFSAPTECPLRTGPALICVAPAEPTDG